MHGWRLSVSVLYLCGCLSMVSACTRESRSQQTMAYIHTIKQTTPQHASSKPTQVRAPRYFSYGAGDLRSPFQVSALAKRVARDPSFRRPKPALAVYTLDELQFAGLLTAGKTQWIVIQSPDQMLHRLRIGDVIGQNFGKIMAVNAQSITINELIFDKGRWKPRQRLLSLGKSV